MRAKGSSSDPEGISVCAWEPYRPLRLNTNLPHAVPHTAAARAAECREFSGSPGTQLPSFPVEWRLVECGSLIEGDIYLRIAPGKPVR